QREAARRAVAEGAPAAAGRGLRELLRPGRVLAALLPGPRRGEEPDRGVALPQDHAPGHAGAGRGGAGPGRVRGEGPQRREIRRGARGFGAAFGGRRLAGSPPRLGQALKKMIGTGNSGSSSTENPYSDTNLPTPKGTRPGGVFNGDLPCRRRWHQLA